MNIDPQQRLLLEVAWEAIQDSGRAPRVHSPDVAPAVFVRGSACRITSAWRVEDAPSINSNSCSGAYRSVASGRTFLSSRPARPQHFDRYRVLFFRWLPIHSACQSLRAGESDLALAGGGVCLHLLPEHYVGLARLGMLSPDGRCKALDASANGFVPSEGCGMVVLQAPYRRPRGWATGFMR